MISKLNILPYYTLIPHHSTLIPHLVQFICKQPKEQLKITTKCTYS